MKKILFIFLFIASAIVAPAQKKRPVNLFLHGQAAFMAYDVFKAHTGAGVGTGLQACLNTGHKLRPQLDASASIFATNKILFVFENGETASPKQMVATITGGFAYQPVSRLELCLGAGPAFIEEGTSFGIKPAAAFYTGRKKTVKLHASLTHLFSPGRFSKSDTGIIDAGLAIKFF